MNNTIKRTTTTIIYKTLVNCSAGAAGDLFKAWKDAAGWHTQNITTGDGKTWHTFISHLRNENFTRIITQY